MIIKVIGWIWFLGMSSLFLIASIMAYAGSDGPDYMFSISCGVISIVSFISGVSLILEKFWALISIEILSILITVLCVYISVRGIILLASSGINNKLYLSIFIAGICSLLILIFGGSTFVLNKERLKLENA